MINNQFQRRKSSKMGLKKISKLIGKINVLHDSLLSIDEEISSIEKDLLLNYIRQLYEKVLAIKTDDPIYGKPLVPQASIEPPKKEKKKKETIKIQVEVPEVIDSVENKISESKEVVSEVNQISPEEQKIEHSELVDMSTEEVNAELVEMFEMKEAKELSEKLSSMPIKDLSNAMGINDRFLTVNDLFGGDNDAFKDCIKHINELGSYDEAKSYLLYNAAQQFDWSSAKRLKKAAGFISLVQRRFK